MEEKVFFEHGGVKVTNARFMVDGKMFAMNNVTSVGSTQKKPSRLGGILVLVIGLAMMSAGVNNATSMGLGLLFAAAAAYYLYQQKTAYSIVLSTAGGETAALTTDEKAYLDRVVAALNEAIVQRG